MKLLQIDAFTSQAFRGNPAAVCLLNAAADPEWMQRVAAEMNVSETAFVYPLVAAEGEANPDFDRYHLRWFTPTIEVDLCGHATLATAHALWTELNQRGASTQGLWFETRSGGLIARQEEDWICLNFPATVSTGLDAPPGLGAALGLTEPPLAVVQNPLGYLVQVASAAIVANLQPNFTQLQTFDVPGTIVTAQGDEPYDFTSRFFAPNLGIPEDPVTGSAHCGLAPYWHHHLGKTEFLAYQASPRGGVLRVTYQPEEARVVLRGQAVTVLRGDLLV